MNSVIDYIYKFYYCLLTIITSHIKNELPVVDYFYNYQV